MRSRDVSIIPHKNGEVQGNAFGFCQLQRQLCAASVRSRPRTIRWRIRRSSVSLWSCSCDMYPSCAPGTHFCKVWGSFWNTQKFRCYWVKKTSQVSFSLQCLVVKVCTGWNVHCTSLNIESHILNRTSNCSCKTWLKQCLEIPWWLSRFISLQVDASGLMMGWTILRWNKINHWLSVVENMAGFRGSACGSTWFQDAAANCQWKTSSLAMKPSKLIVYQPVPHLSACQQPSI